MRLYLYDQKHGTDFMETILGFLNIQCLDDVCHRKGFTGTGIT